MTLRWKIVRVSRGCYQARKAPTDSMWQNGEICQGVVHRGLHSRFAKRAMEQWAVNSQGTIAFCFRTLRKTALFFLQVLLFAHAVVFSMFPVFLA